MTQAGAGVGEGRLQRGAMHGSKRAMAEPQLGAPVTPRDGRAVAARAASRPAGGGRHAGSAGARKRSRGEVRGAAPPPPPFPRPAHSQCRQPRRR